MRFIPAFLMASTLAMTAQAQTLIAEEDFEGGAADWVDVDRNAVTHFASGGHDGGAYISVTDNINTSSGGNFGGYTVFRCAVAPSQLPSQNCSGGIFVGNWYFVDGVQQLRFWFRHNSTKPGGLVPSMRVATPGNTPGGSGIYPAIPANTWTQVTVLIDPQSAEWDENWGSLVPNAVQVFSNVGRLQPGYFVDPNAPTYTENNVKFDIDDVQILGSPVLTAQVEYQGVMHPHHDGQFLTLGSLPDDPAKVIIYGASTAAGDPVDIDTNDILIPTMRIGRLGGVQSGAAAIFGLDADSDGLDDAQFQTRNSLADTQCDPTWARPSDMPVRAELSTGEIIAGIDLSITVNCNAQCHK